MFKEEFLCYVTYSICLVTELFVVEARLFSNYIVLVTFVEVKGFFGGFIDWDKDCDIFMVPADGILFFPKVELGYTGMLLTYINASFWT